MQPTDCFHILQISPHATHQEARTAYMRLVKRWHPDRFADNPRMREVAQEKLKGINSAYQEVKSAISARDELASRRPFSKPPPASSPNLPRTFFSSFRNLVPNRLKRFFAAGPGGASPHSAPGRRRPKSSPSTGMTGGAKDFQKIFNEAVQKRTGAPYRVHPRTPLSPGRAGKKPTARSAFTGYTRVRPGRKTGDRVGPIDPIRKINRVGKIR